MNATTRRIGARIVLSLGLCLALEGVGLAAKPRCGAIQRRAQSKLEQGLAACAEKGISGAIATCSTERWTKYTRQLRRSRCPVASTGRFGNPLLSKVRAEGVSADDLADADVESRDAQLGLRAVLARLAAAVERVRSRRQPESSLAGFEDELTAAIERVTEAEQRLEDVETALWGGMRGDVRLAWLIDEPLRAAMEQVQVETRRLVGPDLRTEIEALRDEPACAGDLIGDRLIAAYGRAVLTPGEDRTAEVAALGRVAAQLACLSVRQASLLDLALNVAYDMVATRLERAGLGRMQDAFARYFAPLEVLVLDTIKLAGDHAHSWQWFKGHHTALADEVARLGWATADVVWLYDRLDGKLVGFPQCANDDFRRCVDVPAFLDSLVDPRALGLGDCAFAGMVAGGLKQGAGVSRYACPSADCDAAAAAPGKDGIGSLPPGFRTGGFRTGGFGGGSGFGGRSSGSGGVASEGLPWSGLTPADLGAIGELGCGGIGGGSGGGAGDEGGTQGRSHGGAGDNEDCVQQAISAPRDPYAAYVQCATTATDGGPAASLDLRGVPTAPECSPGVAAENGMAGGGGATSTTTPPSSGSTTTVATSDTTSTTEAPSAIPCVATGPIDLIQKLLDCGLSGVKFATSTEKNKLATKDKPGPGSAAGAVVAIELELLKPENAKNAADFASGKLDKQIQLECLDPGAGRLSAEECAAVENMKPLEAAQYLRDRGKLKDCAPDQECDAVCTGIDEQVKQRLDDCQRQLTDSLVGDAPKQNDPITRINPAPDADTGGLPDDPLASCLLASAPDGSSSGRNLGCGLVLCTDGASTAKASSACCGQASPAIGVSIERVVLEHTCETVQCSGDESAVADGLGACGCGSAGGGIGGGTPSPRPGPPQHR